MMQRRPLRKRWHSGTASTKLLFLFGQDDVDAEIRQIELSDRDAQGSLRELLTQWRLPLLVTTTLAVFQQLTGQTNVLNYTVEIFQASGLAAIAAPAVWLGSIKVVFTIFAIAYVSRQSLPPYTSVSFVPSNYCQFVKSPRVGVERKQVTS